MDDERGLFATEFGYTPCRDERCDDEGVHPAHAIRETKTDKQIILNCPCCSARLIKMPKRRARCSRCAWRGTAKKEVYSHA